MQSQDYVFKKPYADLDLQTRRRANGKRYITHDPFTGERIDREDQITMKRFRKNPYGPPVLDPNVDFSSVFDMLGVPNPQSGGGGLGSAFGGAQTRGGVLSSALFGRTPIIQRMGVQ